MTRIHGRGCRFCALSRRGFLGAGAAALAAPALAAPARRWPTVQGIDFHAHMIDPERNRGASGPNRPLPAGNRMVDPTVHLADMDRAGIAQQVITMSNAIQGASWGDAQTDLTIHKRYNDLIADRWVKAHPGRFIGSCTLPLQDLDLALPELDRAVTRLAAKVVQVSSCTPDGIYFGDPKLRPFWAAVAHHKVVVFVHPHGNATDPPLNEFSMTNSIGQAIEEAKFMGSVIHQGVLEQFPDVKIVVAHGGGFLPHYYGRMDRNARGIPDVRKNIKKLPSEYLTSFYYDSCVYSPRILEALIKVVGVDRLVLGGDYPVGVLDPLEELRETESLSDADYRNIAERTPKALLRL